MWMGLRGGIRTAALMACFAGCAGVSPAVAQQAGTPLEFSSPLDYQVFQRETRLRGTVRIEGRSAAPADAAEARISGRGLEGALPARWQKLGFDAGSGEFHADLGVEAGGFYKVEVRLLRDSHVVAGDWVPHVGVGEVFVVSGQSNATNYGEVAQKIQTGMVTTFDGQAWRVADDPQPGVQDNSKKGSFVPAFGDALFRRYRVPIGIASVGHGSTSVRQWLPAGEPVQVMPTMTKFVVTGADGSLSSDGTLFNGMMARIRQLGVHGFRAVLWHQGESDSHQAPEHDISAETYRRMLEDVILTARREAGWNIPWFVAEASYHTPQDTSTPPIREAQRSLWAGGVALEGPDTDTLTGENRQNNGTGTHFSDAGLKAHGLLWATAVERYLDTVLR